MIKNPIPKVSHKKQFRAIGIIYGRYKPLAFNSLHKGFIQDEKGLDIDAVVLGKALPVIKKYIKLERNYYWIVYPRNKNSSNLHIQIVGIWDPNNFQVSNENDFDKVKDLLSSLNLKDNLFSIRGKLIFINEPQKEFVVKIYPTQSSKSLKSKSFKLLIKGIIPMKFINSFISLEVTRKEKSLFMDNFEIIEE
tara:strand:+ start:3349 stop:3927 length:579 start_codon:yes stop_codon:yes gene_type:complete